MRQEEEEREVVEAAAVAVAAEEHARVEAVEAAAAKQFAEEQSQLAAEAAAAAAIAEAEAAKLAELVASEARLREFLRSKGKEELILGVIASLQQAGYAPEEWFSTVSLFSHTELGGFLGAISAHYTTDGHQKQKQQKGTSHNNVRDIAEKLKDVAIFAALALDAESDFLATLALELTPRRVAVGSMIIQQGEVGTEMYFLTRGEVEVLISVDGNDKAATVAVATLGAGASFGEIALMSEEPRNAYIKASKGVLDMAVHGSEEKFVELYVLSKPGLQNTLERYPAIQDALEEDAWLRRSQQSAFVASELEDGSDKITAAEDETAADDDDVNDYDDNDDNALAHALAEGHKQVSLTKAAAGFGMQIDRIGFIVSYGSIQNGPAEAAGVEIGDKITHVNGFPVQRKQGVIDILSSRSKCPSSSVVFSLISARAALQQNDEFNDTVKGLILQYFMQALAVAFKKVPTTIKGSKKWGTYHIDGVSILIAINGRTDSANDSDSAAEANVRMECSPKAICWPAITLLCDSWKYRVVLERLLSRSRLTMLVFTVLRSP